MANPSRMESRDQLQGLFDKVNVLKKFERRGSGRTPCFNRRCGGHLELASKKSLKTLSKELRKEWKQGQVYQCDRCQTCGTQLKPGIVQTPNGYRRVLLCRENPEHRPGVRVQR
jgi:hypothetical protein